MVKPFDFEELLVRLQVLVRRNMSNKSTTKIVFWDYEMDLEDATVMRGKKFVHLSALEFNLLKYLLQKQGHIVPKEELYEKVWWEFDIFKMGKTVDVYIGYLRKKLGVEVTETVKGRGIGWVSKKNPNNLLHRSFVVSYIEFGIYEIWMTKIVYKIHF